MHEDVCHNTIYNHEKWKMTSSLVLGKWLIMVLTRIL